MSPLEMIAVDLWMWLKWNAIWLAQRLTRYLMPHSGLKAGFRFGPIRVYKVEWYSWGYRRLDPRIEYHDGKEHHASNWEQFCWMSWEEFLSSCAVYQLGLPENCVWVVDEQELP